MALFLFLLSLPPLDRQNLRLLWLLTQLFTWLLPLNYFSTISLCFLSLNFFSRLLFCLLWLPFHDSSLYQDSIVSTASGLYFAFSNLFGFFFRRWHFRFWGRRLFINDSFQSSLCLSGWKTGVFLGLWLLLTSRFQLPLTSRLFFFTALFSDLALLSQLHGRLFLLKYFIWTLRPLSINNFWNRAVLRL